MSFLFDKMNLGNVCVFNGIQFLCFVSMSNRFKADLYMPKDKKIIEVQSYNNYVTLLIDTDIDCSIMQ